ncbi:hypothetical protein MXB_3703 [Myxobolus squamalis]|nr:hypothetical protein MXB_3703 [Myxobolus squamalis]
MNKLDSVYCDDPLMIYQYLLAEKIKVYSGSKNDHAARTYNIGQVNANDDKGLIYGSWSEKKDGTSPTAWTNAVDIYSEYLENGTPVKWGQCFIFSMLVTSMCRNMGIISKSVSGFDIAHDENKDGTITIYLEESTMKNLSASETLWYFNNIYHRNFHAWNNVLIKRNDLNIYNSNSDKIPISWQHLDGTPQERSEGIYQCGPYKVELLGRDIYNRSIPYDGESVYYSINYRVKRIIMGKNGNVLNQYMDDNSCDLIVSTDVFNKKQEITREYKSYKTLKSIEPEKSQIKLDLTIPLNININDCIQYEISVENASADLPTILSLSVELQNIFGKRILDTPLTYKSIIFQETSYNFKNFTDPILLNRAMDLTLAVLCWELRYYDRSKNILKAVKKSSAVLPSLTAYAEVQKRFIFTGEIPLKLKITNKTNIDVKNSTIVVLVAESKKKYTKNVSILSATSTSEISMSIPVKKPGYYTLHFHIQSPIYNGKMAKEKILTFIK